MSPYVNVIPSLYGYFINQIPDNRPAVREIERL